MNEDPRKRLKNEGRPTGERRREDPRIIARALEKRGRLALRVRGTSMLPWVRPGDIAIIRKTEGGGVCFGDVALLVQGERLLVHRIVGKDGDGELQEFLAKGDAHLNADGAFRKDQVLGRVVRIFRNGKRINLDEPRQRTLGALRARISLLSRLWYPAARIVAVTTRPMRRLLAMVS
jgi:hypothetical protein